MGGISAPRDGDEFLLTIQRGAAEDVNNDGVVNILDLVHVATNLGQMGQNDADINMDGVVNVQDLVKVAGVLGNAACRTFRAFLSHLRCSPRQMYSNGSRKHRT